MQNVLLVHDDAFFLALRAPIAQERLQFFLRLFFPVAHLRRALEILILDGFFFFAFDLLDFGFERFAFRRARHRADARARTGLIQNVNRLVRQKPVGDVTVGKFHGSLNRLVRELGPVMLLVFVAHTFENRDRILNRRRVHLHRLKTALQRGVLLDVFAIFIQRGRADALHLTA